MVGTKNACNIDMPSDGVCIQNKRLSEEQIEDEVWNIIHSISVIMTCLLAMTGFILFATGLLSSLENPFIYQDTWVWTIPVSVFLIGVITMLIARLNYSAILLKDLNASLFVLSMLTFIIVIQLVLATYIRLDEYLWPLILHYFMPENVLTFAYNISAVQILCWVSIVCLCDEFISNAKEPEWAILIKYLNILILACTCLTVILF